MVSDSELATRLEEILRSSDLDTATSGSVRRQLEEDFGIDLSDRKAFVRDQIDCFLQTHLSKPKEEEEEGEEEENAKQNISSEENGNGELEEDYSEEEQEEDDERKGKRKVGRSNKADKDIKKRRGGFCKLCSLSPLLQKVVGVPELARTEVVKKIWAYIRDNNMQDPKDKRNILCDETFRALFHVNSINMFKMNKALTKHIWPLDAEDENGQTKRVAKESSDSMSGEDSDVDEEEEKIKEVKNNGKGNKKGGSSKVDKDAKNKGGFNKLCSLSPQLQELTGSSELARPQVVKKLWAYIREKNLQDPKKKRNIICDESLRALFKVDSIDMFQMNKALSKHIWPLNVENAASDNYAQTEKQDKPEREAPDGTKQKVKRQKEGGSD